MIRALPYIGGFIIVSIICGFFYRAGQNSVQVKWEMAKVVHANALIAQESRHRTVERKWGESTALLVTSIRAAQEAVQGEYENTIADIESGAVRLRGDLAGCRGQLSQAPATTERDNGASDGGLSEARQCVVVRIGRDADRVVARLQGCQQYVRAIQQ